MRKVLLLTQSDDCSDLASFRLADYDGVALAFWSSSEFQAELHRAGAKESWPLEQFCGDYPSLLRLAYDLAHSWVLSSPSYRGILPLLGWENTLANALSQSLGVYRLAAGLAAQGGVEFILLRSCEEERLLNVLAGSIGETLRVRSQCSDDTPAGSPFRPLSRLAGLWKEASRAGDWGAALWVPLETADARYRLRQSVWGKAKLDIGGDWLYSSYVNYSRALATLPSASRGRWLVNGYSARRGLPPGAQWSYLWQFPPLPASVAFHAQHMEAQRAYLQATPGGQDAFPFGGVLRASAQLDYLLARILPLVLAEIDLMAGFLEQTQPASVWVGNQWGSEGALLQLASKRRVPTVQTQHGTLEPYYSCAPIYSDRFLVWSEMWQNAVNPAAWSEVDVVEPGLPALNKRNPGASAGRVTFFTTPLRHFPIPFINPSVAEWEAVRLLDALASAGRRLLIRVHPADRIESWRAAWARQCGTVPAGVQFDKAGSLTSVLDKTDVALMFFSTVYQECLAAGIPVVSLGWNLFYWRDLFAANGLVQFAGSIQEAFGLVHERERRVA